MNNQNKRFANRIFILILALVLCLSVFAGCSAGYESISAQEAKELMQTQSNYVILDVRTQQEFDEKHIPGAMLIPDTEIEAKAEEKLKNKDQLILVYCRSGNRSKKASQKLADMGYTNVKEFGGINDWPYETV